MRQDWKQVAAEILTQRLQPAFVLVFGSVAAGEVRKESDIDLAYYSNKILSNYERFLLAGEIANNIHREIDLVDIRKIDTVFAAQIFSSGELLLCANQSIFIKERMRALSMYVTLNEQRAEILRSIKERGSVYGE